MGRLCCVPLAIVVLLVMLIFQGQCNEIRELNEQIKEIEIKMHDSIKKLQEVRQISSQQETDGSSKEIIEALKNEIKNLKEEKSVVVRKLANAIKKQKEEQQEDSDQYRIEPGMNDNRKIQRMKDERGHVPQTERLSYEKHKMQNEL